ncbi:MAG: 4-hydroxythreonine-4-phosphate dehydrogenase PdxA [Gammaproteobacteria bacterium]|nr:4-hydroxythreonine-4-phosphate dehydrogenase PdxA [Gammaproteobacteria bacterium]
MPDRQRRIAITAGEPAGVGPDIISSLEPGQFDARLIIIGDSTLIESRARALDSRLELVSYQASSKPAKSCIEVIHVPLEVACTAGKLNKDNAAYVLSTLKYACQGCLESEFDAMVTAPIQKNIINQSGVAFSGHTEYLAELCGAARPVMLLATEQLRVALVTTHLPLREVSNSISQELIMEIACILDHDLKQRFDIAKPHIKVCGLNPHAGESGYLGQEEIEIIIPSIDKLKQQGLNISGPYPADTVFTPRALNDADVVLAMYHDQGLPVLKHAGFHRAINTTLGLPIIRTSVDHGTALDLAGSGTADPGSLHAAIESAISQSKYLKLNIQIPGFSPDEKNF